MGLLFKTSASRKNITFLIWFPRNKTVHCDLDPDGTGMLIGALWSCDVITWPYQGGQVTSICAKSVISTPRHIPQLTQSFFQPLFQPFFIPSTHHTQLQLGYLQPPPHFNCKPLSQTHMTSICWCWFHTKNKFLRPPPFTVWNHGM